MDSTQHNWIANFIWGIADDVLRDLYVRGKYRDVILPMTVLRRLDAVLEPTKQAVLDMKASLDKAGIANQDQALRQAAGQAFYNTSKFTLRDLAARASQQQLKADFEAYLDGFSPNVQDILDNFEFRNQIPRLSKADALGTLIEKFSRPDDQPQPEPGAATATARVKHPGLDNHAMGTIFEELVRRFNEENNEEAGEHWTPRDAVKLMAKLIFLPIADQIESGTYLLYDGACGTGGMLTVAEETLQQLAARARQAGRHAPLRPGDQRRDLRHLQGRPAAQGRRRGGGQHRRRPGALDARRTTPSRRASSTSCSRIRPTARAGRATSSAWAARTASRTRASSSSTPATPSTRSSPAPATARCCSWPTCSRKMKHGTTLGSRIAEVHNGSLALHRRRRPGREQHPPLDHRERLARSHRRPAAEHVLQHRHRDLHLGAHQPQAGAPPGARCSSSTPRSGSSRCARTSARRTASCRTRTSSASATRSSRSRRPSSRRSSRTRPSATGR